jgi:branched-chain amino acid transport system substrate-binding protein
MSGRVALIALTVLALVACSQSTPSAGGNALVIGASYPLTVAGARRPREELAGVQAALQVAESSGALHRTVVLRVIDAVTPDAAVAAVDRLVKADHVPAILGTYGSTLSTAASARAEQLKTVYWETGAVADPITAQRRYVFRTVTTGSSLGREAVTFTHDVLIPHSGLKSPRAVVVQVDDVYGHSVGGGEVDLARQLGIDVVDVITYNPGAFDAGALAARIASELPDYLWDVSYLSDGVAIWPAIVREKVLLLAATAGARLLHAGLRRQLCPDAIGVYAADKPDANGSVAAFSPYGKDLLARARAAYARNNRTEMSIPAVAGFVGAWALFDDVLGRLTGPVTPDSIRDAALRVDVPAGDSINGGGVRFGQDGSLDEGQNTRAAAVVGQWQGIENMQIVYPAAYATAKPMGMP